MEKKLILIFVLLILPLAIASSIPQFLFFQGDVKIDGRTAPNGTIIKFSINKTEIANAVVSNGKYSPVFIQGFSNLYGKPVNITINTYNAKQKINYVYPQDINLNLSALTEKALKFSLYYPSEKTIKADKTGEILFDVSAETGYSDLVIYRWFLDNIFVARGSSYDYNVGETDSGEHNITVIANDGFLTISKEWKIVISRPTTPAFDGATTDFSSMNLDDLKNVKNVILEKSAKGKIEFLDNLNLIGITNIDNIIKIENGVVAIDTLNYPQLNKPARITLRGLSYTTIPKIYYSNGFTTNPGSINTECTFCTIENYTNFPTTNGTVVFSVPHFTSFKIAGSGIKYNLSLFNHLDTCEKGEQGNLNITLKKPIDSKDFNPGDKIEIKVKVKNNNEQKKKVIVEAILYNIDEDDEETYVEGDKKSIKAGDSENFGLEFNVPYDINEDDRYILFVKAYENGEEDTQCAQKAIDVNFERKNSDLKIKKLEFVQSSINPGNYLDVMIDVENYGDDDEEVYISLNVNKLGISERVGPFELEEYGEDNSLSEIFSIKIPENAGEGNYTLDVLVEGEDSDDLISKEFSISKLETPTLVVRDMIELKSAKTPTLLLLKSPPQATSNAIAITPKKREITSIPFLEGIDKNLLIIDSVLAFFIVFIVILIAVVIKRKY